MVGPEQNTAQRRIPPAGDLGWAPGRAPGPWAPQRERAGLIIITVYLISGVGVGKSYFGRGQMGSTLMGIHYRGVQWEGGAVDWGSII